MTDKEHHEHSHHMASDHDHSNAPENDWRVLGKHDKTAKKAQIEQEEQEIKHRYAAYYLIPILIGLAILVLAQYMVDFTQFNMLL